MMPTSRTAAYRAEGTLALSLFPSREEPRLVHVGTGLAWAEALITWASYRAVNNAFVTE